MKSTDSVVLRLNTNVKSEQETGFMLVLDSRIVGQEAAKKAAARAKRRAGNPLRNKRGPVYKALLIGKSRTGKTLTAETTALALHGDPDALVRVDCAEYQHGHEVSRLLGAPPSFVGFDDPNGGSKDGDNKGDDKDLQKSGKAPIALLARKNLIDSRKGSKTPITVVLLDEIEKAHSSLKDVLLAIFDKGKIRLANNTETDFTDCIFYLTSNLGMEQLEEFGKQMGFIVTAPKQPTSKDVSEVVNKVLRLHFRPEFLKRLDEKVIFAPLTQTQLEQLVEMELGFIQNRIAQGMPAEARFEIRFAASVQPHILKITLAEDGGVAEVKQIIERDIIDALGGELEKKTIAGGDLVTVGYDEVASALTFDLEKGKGKVPEPPPQSEQKAPTATIADSKKIDGLAELRKLIANKLIETEKDRSLSQKMIHFGTELGSLSRKLGGETKDLDAVQKTFMTEEAHKYLWSKVSNAHWFWKIYEGAAESATSLPVRLSDVIVSVDKLRQTAGVKRISPTYEPDKDSSVNCMRLQQQGVLLLEKTEEGTWKIRINGIFA